MGECERTWDYDHFGLPCTEPLAYDIRDHHGDGGALCAGHAVVMRSQLVDPVVTALPAAPRDAPR